MFDQTDLFWQAYDSHCNLVLGDVTETVYLVDEEDEQEDVRTVKKQSEMLFVRGWFGIRAMRVEIISSLAGVDWASEKSAVEKQDTSRGAKERTW